MNKQELERNLKVRGSLGYSEHEMMEFRILREEVSKTKAGSQPYISTFSEDMALDSRTVQESWLIFEDYVYMSHCCNRKKKNTVEAT